MKTISMKRPATLPVLAIAKFKNPLSWVKFTNLFNSLTGETYSVQDMKVIVMGVSFLLCLCNIYLWPASLIPAILMLKRLSKKGENE